jgi:hypothetical protein
MAAPSFIGGPLCRDHELISILSPDVLIASAVHRFWLPLTRGE